MRDMDGWMEGRGVFLLEYCRAEEEGRGGKTKVKGIR